MRNDIDEELSQMQGKIKALGDEIDTLRKAMLDLRVSQRNDKPPKKPELPQFTPGEKVLVISKQHCLAKATIDCIRGQQFWWIYLPDGTRTYRKHTCLRRLQES